MREARAHAGSKRKVPKQQVKQERETVMADARLGQLQKQIEAETLASINVAVANLRASASHPAAGAWAEQVRGIAARSSTTSPGVLSRGPLVRPRRESPQRPASVSTASGRRTGCRSVCMATAWNHRGDDSSPPTATDAAHDSDHPQTRLNPQSAAASRVAMHQRWREDEQRQEAFLDSLHVQTTRSFLYSMPWEMPVTPWESDGLDDGGAAVGPTRPPAAGVSRHTPHAALASSLMAGCQIDARVVQSLLKLQPTRTVGTTDIGPGGHMEALDPWPRRIECAGAAPPQVEDSVQMPATVPAGRARRATSAVAGTGRAETTWRPAEGRGGNLASRPAKTGGGATAQAPAAVPSLRPRPQTSGGWREAASVLSSLHRAGEIGGTWAAPTRPRKGPECTLIRRRPHTPAAACGGKPSFAAGLLYTGAFSAAAARRKVARSLPSATRLRDCGEESTITARVADHCHTGRYATEVPTWTDTRAIACRAPML